MVQPFLSSPSISETSSLLSFPRDLLEKPRSFIVIEEVKSVFDAITVNDFRVLDDGLQVEGALKS